MDLFRRLQRPELLKRALSVKIFGPNNCHTNHNLPPILRHPSSLSPLKIPKRMAPQTRSMAKSPVGRSTRNSVYGRPPPPPSLTRKGSPFKPTVRAQAQDTNCNVATDTNGGKGTPWLACRDVYGVMTTVAVSETGEGVHMRWYYPDEDIEVDEVDEASVEMMIDKPPSRGATPVVAATHCRPFPQTPMPLHPFDAGSVIRTPVKKPRPLQPSPPRIGDKGIRCLYDNEGILTDLNGGGEVRIILHHPIGSTANLSREQVELLQRDQEERIVRAQVAKLLEERQRLVEEERALSENGYDVEDKEILTDCQPIAEGLRRARLGPEGTELID